MFRSTRQDRHLRSRISLPMIVSRNMSRCHDGSSTRMCTKRVCLAINKYAQLSLPAIHTRLVAAGRFPALPPRKRCRQPFGPAAPWAEAGSVRRRASR
eukprot:382059-Pleurochrysis_carterae.AAC.1